MNANMRALHIYNVLLAPGREPDIDAAHDAGMIKRSDLVDGARYWGYCRNAEYATWCAAADTFKIVRRKLGHSFIEAVPYPTVDNARWDVFVPMQEIRS